LKGLNFKTSFFFVRRGGQMYIT